MAADRPGLMYFDHKLLRCFIQHRKLKLESAPPLGYGGCGLDLADFLAEIVIKDPSEAIHAVVLLSELYSRFQAFDAMHDFASKFIEICLKEYLHLMLNVPKSLHSYANTSFKTDASMQHEHEAEELDFRIRAGCVLKMINCFVEECAHEKRQEFLDLIKQTQTKFMKKMKSESSALARILGPEDQAARSPARSNPFTNRKSVQ